ncbi:MAG: hypothetical protein RL596_248 [Bacteroidota bacterium]
MEQPFILPMPTNKKRPRFFSKAWFRKLFMEDRLAGKNGFLFLGATAVFFALVVGKLGLVPGVLILAALIGLPLIYGLVVHPRFGVTFFLIAAYLIMWVMRLGIIDFPLGTLMDGMELLFIIGFFIKQKTRNEWELFNNSISIIIVIWIVYNLLEVINPSAESRLAWVYTIRSVAVVMLMFYIFLYNIRTKEFIRFIIKLWLVLSTFGALYGLKQQYIGFFQFEENYLNSDPNIANLLFIAGQWRKFSIFSDPVAFSYNMVVSSMLCIGMITGPFKLWKKIVLGGLAGLFLFAMLHSGTRGAFVLPPVALALLAILKFNKQVMMAALIGGLGMVVLIFMPTSNPTIYRFQTAFRPSDDASFNVRKINQKRIQPYILTHPMGGGLGATGTWGIRFAPNSFLANFPPDSGYVRVAVEMGWIGLFLICTLMFIILKTGVVNYYAIRDPELKSYCLSMVLIIFCYHIGNYPQEAIVQFPSNVYFYLVAALIVVTRRIDDAQNAGTSIQNL